MLAMARSGGRLWDWVLGHNRGKGVLRGAPYWQLLPVCCGHSDCHLISPPQRQMAQCKMAQLLSITYFVEGFPFLMQIGGEYGWTNKHRSQRWREKTCLIQMRPFAKVCSSISNMIFGIIALEGNLKSVAWFTLI